ncbi:MAG: universal stress protein [Bacteroidota bacterium]
METQKINRILIPVDFSETGLLALEHGAFMARLFKADLYLLHVVEFMEPPYSLDASVMMGRVEYDEIEKEAIVKLNELVKKIKVQHGVSVIPMINRGRVISGIYEAAKNNNVDLIVMGTHGAKGFDELFVGSNAHKTVTISTCPVITIQKHAKKIGFTNIVIPIDNALHSRQKVETVIQLAIKYGAKIHILGLINSNEKRDENKFNIKIDSVEEAVKEAGLSYVREVIKGKNLAQSAMEYSKKVEADLIVIMTDHESDLTGMFLGLLSKQIINHSPIPVMSIRPIEGDIEWPDLTGTSNPFA